MKRKLLASAFALLSLVWLMGGDCEIEIEDVGWGGGWPYYVYDPGPIWYEPVYPCCWW